MHERGTQHLSVTSVRVRKRSLECRYEFDNVWRRFSSGIQRPIAVTPELFDQCAHAMSCPFVEVREYLDKGPLR